MTREQNKRVICDMSKRKSNRTNATNVVTRVEKQHVDNEIASMTHDECNAIVDATRVARANEIERLSHDASSNVTNDNANAFATTNATCVENVSNVRVVRNAQNVVNRLTTQQLNDEIDALLIELCLLQRHKTSTSKNEQKRVRRMLRTREYFISRSNAKSHDERVEKLMREYDAKYANA